MRSACKIKQRDLMDCGAACLASVSAFYHKHIPVSRLRQLAGTDKLGTHVLGMITAAEKSGFNAKAFRSQPDHLTQVPLPCIAHIIKKDFYHYIVIYKIKKDRVVVMDPAEGRFLKIHPEDFIKQWTGVLILLLPSENFSPGKKERGAYGRFIDLIRPAKALMIQAIVAALMYTILGLAPSFYLQKIFDNVLPGANSRLLNLLTFLMIVILLFYIAFGYFKSLFALKTGISIDARLILGYYKHLLRLPLRFFDTMQTGEIISRVNDAVKIRHFINNTVIEIILNVFILCFSILAMFLYFPKLALLVLLSLPLFGIVYFIHNRLNKKYQKELMEKTADLQSQFVESLNAIGTIKRFRVEEQAASKTENRFYRLLDTVYPSGISALGLYTAAEILTKLITIFILFAGSYYVIHLQLSAGELMSFYSLAGYFTLPLSVLMNANRSVQEAFIASDRLFEITELETEADDGKMELEHPFSEDIIIEDLHFTFGMRTTVFSGLSIIIPKWRSTAIVGESGSGKSTLISLLQNLYQPDTGKILLNHYDIRYISSRSLRKLIAVVPQEIQIFSGTIIENIAIGDDEPDMKKVMDLSRLLGLDEFIEKLPQGYYTLLSEQGLNVSGGERQRVAIARALYRNPEVLIMDEATSSLDPASEMRVKQTIQWFLLQRKTVIIIAHRLSAVRDCDKIIVLKDGRLLEEGNHAALIERKGHYARMWEQFLV